MDEHAAAMDELTRIPGVGRSIAQDLYDLGFRRVEDLRDQDPEAIYRSLMALMGEHVDRCVLYVFRCAVYYASHTFHDPDKLKWWNWKDTEIIEKA
ncbi:helix-hairpin-helix domain-containing protein [Salidesulfovibrio brasiliensis]|uniref:helix-hairpin-helix domain-containing protein n=1 Tax=Salidesulfovibrio brasiliensis TaxID=221711 RepID=UPI0009FA0B29|nr:helix-hairpin-helix domain-containing protein [Salidesulfovibrio brasiliensis]